MSEPKDIPSGPARVKASLAELEQHLGPLHAPVGEPWPKPEPLGGQLPPVERMTREMLPGALRLSMEDIAERMQVPLDFPAVVAVATLAGLVGRRAVIQPKRWDSSWLVVPNLWGGIVAEPGTMKSPIIATITAPAKEIEKEWSREHQAASQSYERAAEDAEIAMAARREQAKKAYASGKEPPARPSGAPEPPAQKRLLTSDATFESLHAILADNPGGIFVLRDELTGWLSGLEQRGREQERGFYLEGWNGDSSYTLDRIGRGTVHVDHVCISLFGGIQPSRLRAYLADALRGGPSNDGLMQRFQLLVWPDITGRKWVNVDRLPDAGAQAQAATMYKRLAHMDASSPLRLRFDDQAQELFDDYLTELERRIRSAITGEVMRAHLGKYRSLMPSLALLFALADGETETCLLVHAQMAAAWCAYLESHALRVYSAQASPQQMAARTLGQKLAVGTLGTLFSIRDVYRNGWTGLSTRDEARLALHILEEANWVLSLPEPQRKPGRKPSETYAINPLLEPRHADC